MSYETAATDEPAVQRWETRAEWPLTIAAIVFLVAYAWPILQPSLPRSVHDAFMAVDYLTWFVFAVDYVVRVVLARRRTRYVWRHLLDLAIVALPIFRPLRLLRLVLLLRALNRQAAATFRGRVATYVSGGALILVVCASLAVLDAERGHPGSNINSFGNALWWSVSTVTTVGYGDHVPVTFEGRAVAVGLMIGGIALIGTVTATLASWLVDRVRDIQEDAEPDVTALHAEVVGMRAELRELRAIVAEAVGPR